MEKYTAEYYGYKVGDKFISNEDYRLGAGRIFVFDEDDGSSHPYFREIIDGEIVDYVSCISWVFLDPLDGNEVVKTFAEELGHKVGDRFRVIDDANSLFGSIVELTVDDGTSIPFFQEVNDGELIGDEKCFHFSNLEKVTDDQTTEPMDITEATITPLHISGESLIMRAASSPLWAQGDFTTSVNHFATILDLLDKLNDASLVIDTSTSFTVNVQQHNEPMRQYVCDTQEEVVNVLNALLTLQAFV